MKKIITALTLFATILVCNISFAADEFVGKSYRVIDNSYTVCKTREQYDQLIKWSLYGVGYPPQEGCFHAPANAKVVIKQCPESDIIVCQFQLSPEDGSPSVEVWATKVMLRPEQ